MKFAIPIVNWDECRVHVIDVVVDDKMVTKSPSNDSIYLAPLSNTWFIPIQQLPSPVRHKIFFDDSQCYWIGGKCHYGKLRDLLKRELACTVLRTPPPPIPKHLL